MECESLSSLDLTASSSQNSLAGGVVADSFRTSMPGGSDSSCREESDHAAVLVPECGPEEPSSGEEIDIKPLKRARRNRKHGKAIANIALAISQNLRGMSTTVNFIPLLQQVGQ